MTQYESLVLRGLSITVDALAAISGSETAANNAAAYSKAVDAAISKPAAEHHKAEPRGKTK